MRHSRVQAASILLIAIFLRLYGIDWDQGQHLHPDERFLTQVAVAVRLPSSFAQYLDEAQSPLNPRNSGFAFYAYGTLPLTVVRSLASITGLDGYAEVVYVGRAASALADIGALLLTAALAFILFRNRRIALLAAALYAFTVAVIQHSHFFVVDPYANLLCSGALVLLALYQRSGRTSYLAGFGALVGLAVAAKITAILLVIPFLAVILTRAWTSRSVLVFESEALRFLLTLLLAFVVFRVAEPYAFQGPKLWNALPAKRWVANMAELRALADGSVDIPPGVQWAGRKPFIFPWINMVVWGMGVPLGLAAWGGWLVAAGRLARRRWRFLILITWVAGVFLYHGSQWVMTMRYFLPIYGPLIVLAAWLLSHAARRWKQVPVIVLAGTVLWGLAFESIYIEKHTRVRASEWIFANIPAGASLANEHWDDALPLPIGGRTTYNGYYRGVEMQWYHQDNPEKLAAALDWLDRADYIILSSNRLYDSIPRLPARYPMTIRYYQALFDGRLGFDKAANFETNPGFGHLRLPSRYAEEAFSVYDHPVVQIFRKSPRYRRAAAEQFLGAVDWDNVVNANAREAAKAPTGLMLPSGVLGRLARSESGPSVFAPDSWGARHPVASWLLSLCAMGLAAWPLVFLTFPGLPDGGYGIARALGLLLVAWGAWFGASLHWFSFGAASLWTMLVALAAFSAVLVIRNQKPFVVFLRTRWLALVKAEALFLATFAMLVWVRMQNPDLWHSHFGGEKPMDFAYLNGVLRADVFPPQNPWFAGATINYYYFGFVLASALIKASGVAPEVGYNLALVTVPALTVSLLAAAAWGLSRARQFRAVAAGALFVIVAGSWMQIRILLDAGAKLVAGGAQPESSIAARLLPGITGLWRALCGRADLDLRGWTLYFDATRQFSHPPGEPQPIAEFPFFTFLYGDLHAHFIGMMILALIAALGAALVCSPPRRRRTWIATCFLLATTCGAAWATNTWDAPAAFGIVSLAVFLTAPPRSRSLLIPLGILAGAYLLFLPYHLWNAALYDSIGLWPGSKTPITDLFLTQGPVLMLAMSGVLALGLRPQLSLRAFAFPVVISAALSLLVAGIMGTILLLACLWLCRVWIRPGLEPPQRFILALLTLALALLVAPEVLVLKGDIGRMNTVFKLHFEAWLLLGLAGTALLPALFSRLARTGPKLRLAGMAGLLLLVASALVYPITAVPARRADRFHPSLPPSLDGMGFMANSSWTYGDKTVNLRGDLRAVRWLRRNITGMPIIAEINTQPLLYGWGSRISTYTGLPALAGWDRHLRQQMGALKSAQLQRRIDDLKQIYSTPDASTAWRLLRTHDAQWFVVGDLERAFAAPEGIVKFEAGEGQYWERVLDGETRVYRVLEAPSPQSYTE